MDGSRIANAAVSLKKNFAAFTVEAGVDVLSFGGTKNGLMFGEAILIFNQELSRNVKYIRKQGMQLHSKMRFISAQFDALLTNDLWKRNAEHANALAKYFQEKLLGIPGITITQPVDANSLFAIIPSHIVSQLQAQNYFYIWNEQKSEARLMCAFDTTKEDIDGFVSRLTELLNVRV